MFERSNTAVFAGGVLLALSITAGTASAAPITLVLPDIREGMFLLVQHDGIDHTKPTIAQLQARQEARKRINKQLQILKKMQLEQALIMGQQRRLMEQTLKRQNTRTQQRQLKSRQQETQEVQKRTTLQDEQRSGLNQSAQRIEQTTTARTNQRNQQEQSIKGKFPALQSYYRSLARRTLRAQNDRVVAPEIPRVP
ncbi:MAG: hypothetical protein HQ513_06220 [Rhodospirillales bacterium]|nr:hypothetical protein [Rhodospirillales bacterium]